MRHLMFFNSILFAALTILVYNSAKAGEVFHDDTRAYVGLQWIFGEVRDPLPKFVLGIRHTRIRANNMISGGDLSLTVNLEKSSPDAIRISYLEGKCNFVGQYGVGYSMEKRENLIFVGVVGPMSKVFAELDGSKNLAPGLELNTQDCARRVNV